MTYNPIHRRAITHSNNFMVLFSRSYVVLHQLGVGLQWEMMQEKLLASAFTPSILIVLTTSAAAETARQQKQQQLICVTKHQVTF